MTLIERNILLNTTLELFAWLPPLMFLATLNALSNIGRLVSCVYGFSKYAKDLRIEIGKHCKLYLLDNNRKF